MSRCERRRLVVPNGPGAVNGGAEAGFDVVIVTLVLVLFLAPHQVSVGITICLHHHLVKRDGRELEEKEIDGGEREMRLEVCVCVCVCTVPVCVCMRVYTCSMRAMATVLSMPLFLRSRVSS